MSDKGGREDYVREIFEGGDRGWIGGRTVIFAGSSRVLVVALLIS